MKINKLLTEDTILSELGRRLTARRIDMHLTQAALARNAGVSKRTIENIENGSSGQLATLIRILRALDLMDTLNMLVPEQGAKPMELLKQTQQARKRVRGKKEADKKPSKVWNWQEDK